MNVKYVDLRNIGGSEFASKFVGCVDISKPRSKEFDGYEIARLENLIEGSTPIYFTWNATGISVWIYNSDDIEHVLADVQNAVSRVEGNNQK